MKDFEDFCQKKNDAIETISYFRELIHLLYCDETEYGDQSREVFETACKIVNRLYYPLGSTYELIKELKQDIETIYEKYKQHINNGIK